MIQKKNISLYDGSVMTLDEIQNKVLYFCIQSRTVNIFHSENKKLKPIRSKFKHIRELTTHANIHNHFIFFKSFIINLFSLSIKFENKKITRDEIIAHFETIGLNLKRDMATQISSQLKKLIKKRDAKIQNQLCKT